MKINSNVSFIPKKSLAKESGKRAQPINILLFVSLLIFFLSIIAYGGLYLYKASLDKVIIEKEKQLTAEEKNVDSSNTTDKAKNLQNKISNVTALLNKHVAPSRVLTFLEEVTLKNVRLQKLNFGKKGSTEEENINILKNTTGSYFVKIKGKAPSYSSLAYQSDILKNEMKEGGRIEDFAISEIGLSEDGYVLFSVDIILKSSFFLYSASFTDSKIEEKLEISAEKNKDTLENQNQ